MRMQYTITFEKDIPILLKKHDELSDFEEQIIDKIYDEPEAYIDGEIINIDDIEWRY